MYLTAVITLHPSDAQIVSLRETIERYTAVYNDCCRVGYDEGISNNIKLQQRTYLDIKSRYDLPSQLIISAAFKAAESLKSGKTRRQRRKKASCPQSAHQTIRFDARCFAIDTTANVAKLTLCDVSGKKETLRVAMRFSTNPHYQKYITKDAKFKSAMLICKKNKYFLYISVDVPVSDEISGSAPIKIGVDQGIKHRLVASNNKFYSDPKKEKILEKMYKLRQDLISKGTRSAKRHLRRLAGSIERFAKDYDHCLSRRFINDIPSGSILIMEDLTGIRDRNRGCFMNRMIHRWSYGRLESFIEYKATLKRITVLFIEPFCTSITCSRCGECDSLNRKSQGVFCCRSCGFTINADLNAARNIRSRKASNGRRNKLRNVLAEPEPHILLTQDMQTGIVNTPNGLTFGESNVSTALPSDTSPVL